MIFLLKPTKGQYTTYISRPLVANDINAYKVMLDTAEDLTDAIFTVEARRADGEIITDAGICTGNAAIYILRSAMIAVAGELILRLRIAKDNALLTEAELICEVVEGFESSNVEYDDRVPALDALTVTTQNAARNANEAAAAAENATEELKSAAANGEFDGYTPVKGVDYFTDAEKAEFAQDAKEHIDDALKEVGWVKYGSIKIDMPTWTIQPQIATLSADGTSIESLSRIVAMSFCEPRSCTKGLSS